MIVKVCGLKEINNINQLNEIDIDLIGFIFYNKSSRFIDFEINTSRITKKKVGVFVNESLENIKKKIKNYKWLSRSRSSCTFNFDRKKFF